MHEHYEAGGFWRECQRCGFKRRNYDTKKEWTGLYVCSDTCWEPRHPQDFVRGRKDRQRVPDPRPVAPMTLVWDFIIASDGEEVISSTEGVRILATPVNLGL